MSFDIYIVTPCFNRVDTIDKTIWSIITQEGGINIRYHIQDAQSTDGTVEKLILWQKKIEQLNQILPSKIIFSFSSQPDTGMYDGINTGFSYLSIPKDGLMGWCNGDDVLWPGALAHIVNTAKQHPDYEWLSGWSSCFDESGKWVWTEKNPQFPNYILECGLANGKDWPCLQQESTFWKKSLWDRAGGVNTKLKLAGDWDLWRRFSEHAQLVQVDRQTGVFCRRAGQKSSNMEGYLNECNNIYPPDRRVKDFKAKLKLSPILTIVKVEDGHLNKISLSLACFDLFLSKTLSTRKFLKRLRKQFLKKVVD